MPAQRADDHAPSLRARIRRLAPVGSWVLYDFSDTIFSASILTFYFPLWVTDDAGGNEIQFTLALSASMLLVATTGPMLGTLSDRLNRRVPLLAVAVVTCAAATALIGMFGGLALGLVLFIVANFLYQSGLIFYNSLIVNISAESNRGIVSGIGIGAGYVGLIVTFLALSPLIDDRGNQAAFLPTAALYILFAIPLFLFVRETGATERIGIGLVRDSYRQLYTTFKRARQHSNLFRFLIARFLYMEAVNTVTSLFVIYLTTVGEFEQEDARNMIILAVLIAIASSWATGVLVSRIGSKAVLSGALVGWICVVAAAAVAWEQWMYWAISGVMGLFWAGPQIADRVLLTRLSPQGQVGEFFGLFQMSGRLAAVVGPSLWALTAWALMSLGDNRFRIAVGVIAVFLVLGYLTLQFVRVEREPSDLVVDDDAAEPEPLPATAV